MAPTETAQKDLANRIRQLRADRVQRRRKNKKGPFSRNKLHPVHQTPITAPAGSSGEPERKQPAGGPELKSGGSVLSSTVISISVDPEISAPDSLRPHPGADCSKRPSTPSILRRTFSGISDIFQGGATKERATGSSTPTGFDAIIGSVTAGNPMRSSSPFVNSKHDASVNGWSAFHDANGAASAVTECVGGASSEVEAAAAAVAAAAVAAAADPVKASPMLQGSVSEAEQPRQDHEVFSRAEILTSKTASWSAAKRPKDSNKPPLCHPPRPVPPAGRPKTKPESGMAIARSSSLSAMVPAAQLPEQESEWWCSAPGRLPEVAQKAGYAAGAVELRTGGRVSTTSPSEMVVPRPPPMRRGSSPLPQAKPNDGRGIRDIFHSPVAATRARSVRVVGGFLKRTFSTESCAPVLNGPMTVARVGPGQVGGKILKKSFSVESHPPAIGGGAVADDEDQTHGCSASDLPRASSECNVGQDDKSKRDPPPGGSALLASPPAAAAESAAETETEGEGEAEAEVEVTEAEAVETVARYANPSSALGVLAFVMPNGNIGVRFERDDTEMVVDDAGVAFDLYYTSGRDAPPSSSPSSGVVALPSARARQAAEEIKALGCSQKKSAAAPLLIPDEVGEVDAVDSYVGAIGEPVAVWVVAPISRFSSSSSQVEGKPGSKSDGNPRCVAAAAGCKSPCAIPSEATAYPPQHSVGNGGRSRVVAVGPACPQTAEGESGPTVDPRRLRGCTGGLPRRRCRYALDCYPFYLSKKVRILRYYREHLLLKNSADDIAWYGEFDDVSHRCGGAPAAGIERASDDGSAGGVAASTGGSAAPGAPAAGTEQGWGGGSAGGVAAPTGGSAAQIGGGGGGEAGGGGGGGSCVKR